MTVTISGSGTISGVSSLPTPLINQSLTTPIISTTMGVGGATPSASGSGITFPATQSASSDANTLDDYEEGTWTPNIKSNGANGNATGGVITGRYTKIGNVVNVWWQFSNCGTSGVANAGQQVCITGLPFTVSAVYTAGYGFSLGVIMTAQTYGNGGIQPVSGTTYMGVNDASLVNGVNIGTDAQYVRTSSIYNNGFASYIAS